MHLNSNLEHAETPNLSRQPNMSHQAMAATTTTRAPIIQPTPTYFNTLPPNAYLC